MKKLIKKVGKRRFISWIIFGIGTLAIIVGTILSLYIFTYLYEMKKTKINVNGALISAWILIIFGILCLASDLFLLKTKWYNKLILGILVILMLSLTIHYNFSQSISLQPISFVMFWVVAFSFCFDVYLTLFWIIDILALNKHTVDKVQKVGENNEEK